MSIVWGSYSKFDRAQLCTGIETWFTTERENEVVVAADTYYWVSAWANWSPCYYEVSGISSDSGSFGINISSSQQVKINRYQKAVPRRYAHQGGAYDFSVYLRVHIPAWGTDSSVSSSITIPRRTYNKPPKPTSATVKKTSSNSVSLSWTVNATDSNWDQWTYIWRKTDGGDYVQLAWVNHGQTTFVDSTIEEGHFYQYGLETQNVDGWSGINHLPDIIVTSLPAVYSIEARKTSNTTVDLNWTYDNKGQSGFEIERSVNSGSFSRIASVGAGVRSYSDTSSPAGTVVYRVRAVAGSIQSAFTESNKVTTIAPPSAATITKFPSQVMGVKLGTTSISFDIEFAHNSTDGSGQTAAEIEVTKKSGTKVYSVTTQKSYTGTLDASDVSGSDIRVRVRTKGLHASFGEWSTPVVFRVRHFPEPSITNPGLDNFVVRNIPLVVTWNTKVDQSSLTSCYLQLFDGDQCVHEIDLSGSATSYKYGLETYFLKNKKRYALQLTVRDANGLVGATRREFGVDYYQPAPAKGVISYNKELASANVTAFYGDKQSNNADTKSLAIYRVFNGKRILLGKDLVSGTTITDKYAPLGVDYTYEVVSVAENGASNIAVLNAHVFSDICWAINYGSGLNEVAGLMYDVSEDISESVVKELVTYAGRDYPVLYCDSHAKEQKISLSATVYEEQMNSFIRLSRYPGVCALRDVRGNLYPVSVSVSYSTSDKQMRSAKLECVVVDYGLE